MELAISGASVAGGVKKIRHVTATEEMYEHATSPEKKDNEEHLKSCSVTAFLRGHSSLTAKGSAFCGRLDPKQARELYGAKEGHHATPSEIAVTLCMEPSLLSKQRPLPDPAPAGPIHGPDDFRQRHPDGRMGSHPSLATAAHGTSLLDTAAAALSEDLRSFPKTA